MIPDLEIVAAILGALATALGGAAASGIVKSVLEKLQRLKDDDEKAKHKNDDLDISAYRFFYSYPSKRSDALLHLLAPEPRLRRALAARSQLLTRLDEARAARLKEQNAARVYTFASHALTFGQYVIGGVLASSFVQEALSPKIVGVFGVLVLIASLIKQQYHPDVSAKQASIKAAQLQALIRETEDSMASIVVTADEGVDDPQPFITLTQTVSKMLSSLELRDEGTSLEPKATPPERS